MLRMCSSTGEGILRRVTLSTYPLDTTADTVGLRCAVLGLGLGSDSIVVNGGIKRNLRSMDPDRAKGASTSAPVTYRGASNADVRDINSPKAPCQVPSLFSALLAITLSFSSTHRVWQTSHIH